MTKMNKKARNNLIHSTLSFLAFLKVFLWPTVTNILSVPQFLLNKSIPTVPLDLGKRFRTLPNVSLNDPWTPEKLSTNRRMGISFIIKHSNVQTLTVRIIQNLELLYMSWCKIKKTNLPVLCQRSTSDSKSCNYFLSKIKVFGMSSRSFNAKSQLL